MADVTEKSAVGILEFGHWLKAAKQSKLELQDWKMRD